MKIQSLDENDVSVTMASGKDQYYQSNITQFSEACIWHRGRRVVIADMASSSVQNDFLITDGPVWGLTLFDNGKACSSRAG